MRVVHMNKEKLLIKSKIPKGDDGYRIFSVRLKEQTILELENICSQSGYSRNELIGIFMDYAISHCEVIANNK